MRPRLASPSRARHHLAGRVAKAEGGRRRLGGALEEENAAGHPRLPCSNKRRTSAVCADAWAT